MFITSNEDQDEQNECWAAGAVDFVTKPVNGVILRNRVKAHLTLKLQTDLLRSMSFVDGLTGLYNRHLLVDALGKGILHARRSGKPLSLLMIDVDWFKQFNDTYGHLNGDECLKSIAAVIKSCLLRPTDFAVRYGGEEFLCLLADTDLVGAKHIAAALLESVTRLDIVHKASPLGHVTVSIGVHTSVPKALSNDNALIGQADAALYQAKHKGRNQFAC